MYTDFVWSKNFATINTCFSCLLYHCLQNLLLNNRGLIALHGTYVYMHKDITCSISSQFFKTEAFQGENTSSLLDLVWATTTPLAGDIRISFSSAPPFL